MHRRVRVPAVDDAVGRNDNEWILTNNRGNGYRSWEGAQQRDRLGAKWARCLLHRANLGAERDDCRSPPSILGWRRTFVPHTTRPKHDLIEIKSWNSLLHQRDVRADASP